MQDFRKLDVWHDAVELAVRVYLLTERIRVTRRFGLVDQLERSALSTPSNLAEGAGRRSSKDKAHFFNMAMTSNSETQTQLIIAERLGLCEHQKELLSDLRTLNRQIGALYRSVR